MSPPTPLSPEGRSGVPCASGDELRRLRGDAELETCSPRERGRAGFANAVRPVANDIILNSFATTFSRSLLTGIVSAYAWALAARNLPDEDEAA